MIKEEQPEEYVQKITNNQGTLFESGILEEKGDDYSVVLDKNEWRTDDVGILSGIDSSLIDATNFEEAAWCGETVTGEEFVDEYMDEFWETLDTHEEYTASIADYVDCGDGRP
ncbi:hypothetical protein [Nocardiopsis sp. LOL_012]|uniref:hypothetical protein n=1 Tax=Nocardiopsis sp. LOL_012 TaxID=3345409 RepID=UPI003A83C6F8